MTDDVTAVVGIRGAVGARSGPADRSGGRALIETLQSLAMIVIAGLGLLFLAPMMAMIALAIRLDSKGPVIYAQRRRGRRGRAFHCYKFRTMQVDAEGVLAALLDQDATARAEWERSRKLTVDPRITRVGLFLRKSSLDELPQIVNVLTRTMNFVGPRPILEDEVRLYGRSLRHYQSVRPGITGPWQVGGRSNTSYSRRVAYDRHYAQNRSLAVDCWILLRTVPAVCTARGAR